MRKKELSEEEKLDQQIVDLLLKKGLKSGSDISHTFNNMYGKIVQRLLDEEFNTFLEKETKTGELQKSGNKRNGTTSKSKKVKTDNGEILISPPRDRLSKFEPEIVKKRQKVLEGLDSLVISMYAKGNSFNDIKDIIKEIYEIDLSEETLSNMTNSVTEEVQIFRKRQLEKCYTFVYVDCLYCYVKEDLKSVKKAVYVVLGINAIGIKSVLGIYIDTTESSSMWCQILEDIKDRGVEKIFFLSMDGLAGLTDTVEKVFSKTITQRCIVHIVRNIHSVCNKKDAKDIIKDFKKIYTSSTLNEAKEEYTNFKEKYTDKASVMKKVESNLNWIYQLFEYPPNIRRLMYTTNAIESVNAALRKVTKGKGTFVNEEALMKVLYLRIKDLEKKWNKGTKDWINVQNEFTSVYKEEYTKYLDLI